jgi:hypothetical protein
MYIYIKYSMMINLTTFLKTLFYKYKRIVLANSTRTLEGQLNKIFFSLKKEKISKLTMN